MRSNQRGSATLLSVLLIGGMLILVGSVSARVKVQYQLSKMGEQTGSTYHLAESGVEMFFSNLSGLIKQAEQELRHIVAEGDEKNIWWIKLKAMQLAYEAITDEYFYKTGGQFYSYKTKSIRYQVKTGGIKKGYSTEIQIIPYINARGFSDTILNKELIDHQMLEKLKNLEEYSEEKIEELYKSICLTEDKKRDREAMQVKVSVTTRDENNLIYNSETLVARIGFNDIDNEHLELSVKVNSLKKEDKKK